MFKKSVILLGIVLIIGMLGVRPVFAAEKDCNLEATISNATPNKDEEFTMNVSVKNVSTPFYSVAFVLEYDSAKVDLIGMISSDPYKFTLVEAGDQYLVYSKDLVTEHSNECQVVDIKFKVKSNAAVGDTLIKLKNVRVSKLDTTAINTTDLEKTVTIKEKKDDNENQNDNNGDNGNQQDNNNQNDNGNQQENNNQNDNNGNNENQQDNNNQNDNNGNNENQQENNNQNDNNGNNENQQDNNNQNNNDGNNENQQDNNNQNSNDGNNENQQDNNNQNSNDGNNGNQQDNNSQNIKIIKAYDNTQDNTKSSKTLPKTGKTQVIILGSILVFAVLAVVFYKNSQKYKGI